jgi:hypothetical protein
MNTAIDSSQTPQFSPRPRTEHPEIKGLIYGAPETAKHEDNRRVLGTMFNGSFHAEQAKYLVFKEQCCAGGHSHRYNELNFILAGSHSPHK